MKFAKRLIPIGVGILGTRTRRSSCPIPRCPHVAPPQQVVVPGFFEVLLPVGSHAALLELLKTDEGAARPGDPIHRLHAQAADHPERNA